MRCVIVVPPHRKLTVVTTLALRRRSRRQYTWRRREDVAVLADLPPGTDPPRPREWFLWLAVMEDAVAVRMGAASALTQHQSDAAAWFASGRTNTGSFLWVCELLGLSPEAVRAALRGQERVVVVDKPRRNYRHLA